MFEGYKYRLTFLNVTTMLFFLAMAAYMMLNFSATTRGSGEGWGMFGLIGFTIFGLIGLLLDFMLQYMIKSRMTLFWVELSVFLMVLMVLAPFVL